MLHFSRYSGIRNLLKRTIQTVAYIKTLKPTITNLDSAVKKLTV